MLKLHPLSVSAAILLSMASMALAETPRGTESLMPKGEWAAAVSDEQLGTMRGGFQGLAFSMNISFFADNTATSSGTVGTTPPLTPTGEPINTTIQNGQITMSTFVGNLGNVSGFININSIVGNFNVLHSHITLNVALINVTDAASLSSLTGIPGMVGIFPR